MHKAYWVWYPGDFSIHQGMLQNFSREERGFRWPAYWKVDDCLRQVRFTRSYYLKVDDVFTVYASGVGYVALNGEKHPLCTELRLKPGINEIEVIVGNPTGLPAMYIEGDEVYSDEGWMADDLVHNPVPVGWDPRFCRPEQDPSEWKYDERIVYPSESTEDGGTLYDFGEELTAVIELTFKESFYPVLLAYGETEREAMDTESCYYSQQIDEPGEEIPRRAFRYLYIPETEPGEIEVRARHQYVDIPVRASFETENRLLQQIWDVSGTTFRLCSGIFMIDGVKRDRWIWSGDAYQSLFVNRYYFSDLGLTERTLWALRGQDPPVQHINTIVDYSLFWILAVWEHYISSGNIHFVRAIYPRMKSLMDFLSGQLDENGLLVGRKGDWIFIDWAQFDKEGAFAAEQFLYYSALLRMGDCAKLSGEDADAEKYKAEAGQLKPRIEAFWDSEKHAYVDSIQSGKRHVSRQTNILAILFGEISESRANEIREHVLENPDVPKITTPYFQFYELEALCRLGKREEVLKRMGKYWGGMLKQGAATFWEEYDPEKPDDEQQEMYGDPYGKSLCHAWSASPIYLLSRYFFGLEPVSAGYETFQICPHTEGMMPFKAELPLPDGKVKIGWDGEKVRIRTDRNGKTTETEIHSGEVFRFE